MLAIPFRVTRPEIAALLGQAKVSGIIVPELEDIAAEEFDGAVGWFKSNNGGWVLPECKARTVVYVGPPYMLRFHMARSALLRGAVWLVYSTRLAWRRELIIVFLMRRVFEKIYHVAARLFGQMVPGLWEQLAKLPGGPKILRMWDRAVVDLRVNRFKRILTAANWPLLPPEAFRRGRVVLANSTLVFGGAERQIVNTIFGLARRGVKDVTLVCEDVHTGPDHDFYLSRFEAARIEVVDIGTFRGGMDKRSAHELAVRIAQHTKQLPSYLADGVLHYARIFLQKRPGVVHSWLDATNIKAGIAAALVGVPRIILSTRNVAPFHFALYLPYMWRGYRALEQLSHVVLVNNSEAGANDYARWLRVVPGRFKIIRNGLDRSSLCRVTDREASAYRAHLGISEDSVVVGGIFRFYKEKDPLLWVRTAATVARARSDVAFLLVGSGSMEGSIRDAARSCGIADRLFMPGTEKNPALSLSVMDVFLLTSEFEGTPNVVIEAQGLGVPVVATDAGGTREAVDHGRTGWIVRSREAGELAERVLFVLANPDWSATARRFGPEFTELRFGVERMISETMNMYG